MRPLVILRPEPAASATAKAARELGLDARVIPLFAVEPVDWQAPDPREFDGVLLTSANAVLHGGSELEQVRDLPAHCVGEATAAAARDFGFLIATAGGSGVDPLLATIPPDLRLLHLCGVDRREPSSPRQSIRAIPVYRAAEIPPPGAIGAIAGAVAAVHSPRAAARFAELVDGKQVPRETVAIAAISGEVAAAAGEGWETVRAAAEPSDDALLALAASLCNNPG